MNISNIEVEEKDYINISVKVYQNKVHTDTFTITKSTAAHLVDEIKHILRRDERFPAPENPRQGWTY
jgi:hypothetical protein